MTESAADTHGELVTTERVALVLVRFVLGERLTTREVADYLGVSWEGAWRMLDKISRVAPLCQVDGVWGWISTKQPG